MNTNDAAGANKNADNISPANPKQQNREPEGEKKPGEGTLIGEEPASGMSMGTSHDESEEQDLDDLMHTQGGLGGKVEIPGPDQV